MAQICSECNYPKDSLGHQTAFHAAALKPARTRRRQPARSRPSAASKQPPAPVSPVNGQAAGNGHSAQPLSLRKLADESGVPYQQVRAVMDVAVGAGLVTVSKSGSQAPVYCRA
jgi:hypothetical protein